MDFRSRYSQSQPTPYQAEVSNIHLRFVWMKKADTRFSNTQERKPVTNSRDTQELLPDAGQEMLRIFHTHPARTSLLQDFAFYEVCPGTSLSDSILKLRLAPSDAENASNWRCPDFPAEFRPPFSPAWCTHTHKQH